MRLKNLVIYFMKHKPLRNLIFAISALFLVIILGTITYSKLIGLTYIDALYFTIVTLGSVGYGDIYPTTYEAKLFTIFFVLVGVSIFLYTFTVINVMIFEGTVMEMLKMEKITHKLSELNAHTVLCGYGDVGSMLAKHISPIVIIDKNEARIRELVENGFYALAGDSTRPEILEKASIKKAKNLIVALDSDPDVLFTIITAKDLNPHIKIYARANHKESVNKMLRVGADYVVCLPELGAKELLNAISKNDIKLA